MIVNPVMYGGGSALKTVTMSKKRSSLTIYYIDENGTLQTKTAVNGNTITINVPAGTTILTDTSSGNLTVTGATYAGGASDISTACYLYYVEP